MKIISGTLKALGPGILFAGAAIGVSHLVQSTRAGASYGFSLFLLVIVTNFLKYPFFEFANRYTAATGESVLKGYKDLGNFALISFLILSFISSFINISAIGLVTTGLAENLFHTGIPIVSLSGILVSLIVVILVVGRYHVLDKMMKILIIVLSITTIVALIAAIQHGSSITPDFVAPNIWTITGIGFMVALMGWMPAPIEVSVWPSLWMLERSKQTAHKPSMKETLLDFYVGYIGAAVLALVFLSLGALIMYGTGEAFSNSGIVFSSQLVNLYVQTLGSWSKIFIGTACLITMFSTLITVMDAYPRVMSESILLLVPRMSYRKDILYWFWVIFLSVGGILILVYFQNKMKTLIDIATIMAFLAAPISAFMNYKIIRSKSVPTEFKPPKWLMRISYAGLVYLISFGLLYFVLKFIY
jgi:Mn2+/Fe2+ NRAMP family transporter